MNVDGSSVPEETSPRASWVKKSSYTISLCPRVRSYNVALLLLFDHTVAN